MNHPKAALAWFRRRLAQCPDTEPEQVALRIFIATAIFAYLYTAGGFHQAHENAPNRFNFWFMASYLAFTWGLLGSILIHPERRAARRWLAMAVDLTATSYGLYAMAAVGAPLTILYLWISIANGFRFGLPYLYGATALSVLEFTIVVAASPFWSTNWYFGASVLVGLVVLPLYIGELIRRQHAASEAKEQFLANISHELRTPLTGVIAMGELLAETKLDGEQRQYAETLRASARTLLALVNDVLDVAQLEARRLELSAEDFDLHRLLASTFSLLRSQAEAKGLALRLFVDADVPYALHGAPVQLQQILINLIGNAIKFTETGQVRVRATLSGGSGPVRVRFEVQDTGVGIAPGDQARIFERFSQVDASMTRRHGGSGLGTTISRALVQLMGGEIGVKSQEGEGSCFWFELPLAASEAAPNDTDFSDMQLVWTSTDPIDPALGQLGVEIAWASTWEELEVSIAAATDELQRSVLLVEEDVLRAARGRSGLVAWIQSMGGERFQVRVGGIGAKDSAAELGEGEYISALGRPIDRRALERVLHLAQAVYTKGRGTAPLPVRGDAGLGEERSRAALEVLVADDDPANQVVLAQILRRVGHTVVIVEDGDRALEALVSRRFDAAVIDLHMPKLDGIEAIRRYQRGDPSADLTPCIILTANAMSDAEARSEGLVIDAYLTKPIAPSALIRAVERAAVRNSAHLCDNPPNR